MMRVLGFSILLYCLVAASDAQGLSVLTVDKELAPGSKAR